MEKYYLMLASQKLTLSTVSQHFTRLQLHKEGRKSTVCFRKSTVSLGKKASEIYPVFQMW